MGVSTPVSWEEVPHGGGGGGDSRASACFVELGESLQLAELLHNEEVSSDDPESSCGSLALPEVPSGERGVRCHPAVLQL